MNPIFPSKWSPGLRLALYLPLLLAGCASVPATHLLLPGGNSPAHAALPESGAAAHILTVTGDELDLQVLASTPAEISGTGAQAGAMHVAMDAVAAAYYRNPARDAGSNQLVAPDTNRLPKARPPGIVEAGLSCAALDTELARAEALHGYLRRSGFQPYTSGEQVARHAGNAALYAAATVVIVAACSAGCGGMGFPGSTAAATPDKQDFRWALTSTDNRLQGLLSLKSARACPGRQTLDGQHTDVELWSGFTAWRQGAATGPAALLRDRRTGVFDLLGPRPVGAATASGREASSSAE